MQLDVAGKNRHRLNQDDPYIAADTDVHHELFLIFRTQ